MVRAKMTRETGITSNFTNDIHNLISHISCIFLLCFVGGLAFIVTGSRILYTKKVTVIGPKPSIFDWNNPITLKGASSRFYGIFYVSFGALLFFISMLILFGDVI
jgi:hypothetical protein